MKLIKTVIGCSLSAILFTGCSAKNNAMPPQQPQAVDQSARAAAPQPPSQEEMMRLWKEYSTPGVEHEKLKALTGKWKYTSTMWHEPGKPPEVAKGTSDNKLILGGRFLEQTYKGKAMGQPFEGRGIMGYDKVAKEYSSIWIDNMMTGISTAKGQFDQASNTLKENGSGSCPIEQGPKSFRTVWDLKDPNKPRYEMYANGFDGKEMKMLEIEMTR